MFARPSFRVPAGAAAFELDEPPVLLELLDDPLLFDDPLLQPATATTAATAAAAVR
jgi:hypothetical protein